MKSFLILLIAFCFLSFNVAQAANPLDVTVNEIAWMGAKVEGIESKNWWRYEWLELYNNAGKIISLDGWKIELYRDKLDWSLELKGQILPESYFLIVASDKISTDYDLNYSNLGGKLNNSGQKVLLKDGLGNIVDSFDCFSYGKWFAGDNDTKQTMERKNSHLSGNNPGNWQTSQNPGGTIPQTAIEPQEPQVEPQPELEFSETPTDSVAEVPLASGTGIIINEILPYPEGPDAEEEWIEIFNQNNFEVDLSDWQITDTAGKTTTYTFPPGTEIGLKSFLVLPRTTAKITLNNDEDGLLLFQPNGSILDSISYQKAPRGQSYNRTPLENDSLTGQVENGWTWSNTLTPGSMNIIPTLTQKPEEEEKEKPQKELATVSESFRQTQDKRIFKSLFTFLVALCIAIFSGTIILILRHAQGKKKKIRKVDLLEKLE